MEWSCNVEYLGQLNWKLKNPKYSFADIIESQLNW